MHALIEWFRKYLKRHIVDEFPHPDACFMCHLGDCEGCPILTGGE